MEQKIGKELLAALSKLQTRSDSGLRKEAENPHYKNKYVNLEALMDYLKEPLSVAGLAVTQTVSLERAGATLVTTLWHIETTQSISSEYPLNPVKQDPQGFASSLTYARRYSLMSLLGIAASDDDDDGNGASLADKQRPTISNSKPIAPRKIEPKPAVATAPGVVPAGQFKGRSVKDLTDAEITDYLAKLNAQLASKNQSRADLKSDAKVVYEMIEQEKLARAAANEPGWDG